MCPSRAAPAPGNSACALASIASSSASERSGAWWKQQQFAHVRRLGRLAGFAPRRVPETLARWVFLICVHGVVDHQVRTFRKRDKCFIYIGFSVFVVRQVNKALAVTIHPPGQAAARVVGRA
jgi:hypothetical protein